MLEVIKAVKEYGITAILIFALFWMNAKLSQMDEKVTRIEDKLFNCFEERIKDNTMRMFGRERETSLNEVKVFGILPDEIKVKRERFS
jgi:hypothetical protein